LLEAQNFLLNNLCVIILLLFIIYQAHGAGKVVLVDIVQMCWRSLVSCPRRLKSRINDLLTIAAVCHVGRRLLFLMTSFVLLPGRGIMSFYPKLGVDEVIFVTIVVLQIELDPNNLGQHILGVARKLGHPLTSLNLRYFTD